MGQGHFFALATEQMHSLLACRGESQVLDLVNNIEETSLS